MEQFIYQHPDEIFAYTIHCSLCDDYERFYEWMNNKKIQTKVWYSDFPRDYIQLENEYDNQYLLKEFKDNIYV